MEDKYITCEDCQQEFVWPEKEQAFYKEKGFSQPKRCKPCRDARKAQREGGGRSREGRPQTEITCRECGKTDTVPFIPRNKDDVLCRECHQASKDFGR